VTDWGRELCLELEPQSDPDLINILLDQTAEAVSLLEARSPLPLDNLADLRETLKRLAAGAELSAAELLSIGGVLEAARLARSTLALLEATTFPRLVKFVPRLHPVFDLAAAIDQAIDPAGYVKDSASPRLSSLRKDIRRLENQIKDELSRIIHSPTLSRALQEPLYTQRGNRFVLPVIASSRNVIEGIVHDSSASGLTVYVEPMAVIELANKMRLKEADVEREIARILSDLSGRAAGHAVEVEESFRSLVELDVITARARLARKYRGNRPELSSGSELALKAARHPLLILQDPERASRVVPNDIVLGGKYRTMVVTGPNTGGKTVLLKTAGLLSLMVRAGLLLPVAPGSVAVNFRHIYADIGDEQSLVQSLSTFSSHMTSIVEIINRAGGETLVLLDEIGAGTDPREGAALARAILEFLNESGALTISTTHFGELKTLAYGQPGFINASLDFDEASLAPTYKLRLGVPGASKATTIAARLGLKPGVVERAGAYLARDDTDLERLTRELEERLKALAEQEESVRLARAEAEDRRLRAQAELEHVERERRRLRGSFAAELEAIVKQAREQVRELIASLQKEPSIKRAQEGQKELERIREELGWAAAGEEISPLEAISIGQTVKVRSLNRLAVVESVPPDLAQHPDSRISVRAGGIKLKIPLADLEAVPAAPAAAGGTGKRGAAPEPVGARSAVRNRGQVTAGSARHPDLFVRTAGNTLDLRGQRVEQALGELERFLDRAVVAGGGHVMIIHGHGTGAVKSAVREYLASSSYAGSFRPGETYEGGDGVTIVDLG